MFHRHYKLNFETKKRKAYKQCSQHSRKLSCHLYLIFYFIVNYVLLTFTIARSRWKQPRERTISLTLVFIQCNCNNVWAMCVSVVRQTLFISKHFSLMLFFPEIILCFLSFCFSIYFEANDFWQLL